MWQIGVNFILFSNLYLNPTQIRPDPFLKCTYVIVFTLIIFVNTKIYKIEFEKKKKSTQNTNN